MSSDTQVKVSSRRSKFRYSFITNLIEWVKEDLWLTIFIVGLLGSMVLGFYGFYIYVGTKGDLVNIPILDCIYATLQLITLDSGSFSAGLNPNDIPLQLHFARFFVPLFSAFTILKTVCLFAKERYDLFKIKFFYNEHVVICGLGWKGRCLVKELTPNKKIVVIENDAENEEIKTLRANNIKVIIGNASDATILIKANIRTASEVYVVTGKDEVNIKIAYGMFDLKAQVKCHVHIQSQKLISHLNRHEMFEIAKDDFDASMFNLPTIMAYHILNDDPLRLFSYAKQQPHLLLIGYNDFSEILISQLAQYYCNAHGFMLKITIADNTSVNVNNRIRHINEFLTLEQTIKLDEIYNDEIINNVDFNCVCINSEVIDQSLSYAYHIKRINKLVSLPIVSVTESPVLLNESINNIFKLDDISIINMTEMACKYVIGNVSEIENMAIKLHRSYQIIEQRNGKTIESNPRMDDWNMLNEEFKESNRNEARSIFIKLKAIGIDNVAESNILLSEDQIELLAKMEHKRWMFEKYLNGWEYGTIRDNNKKIHNELKQWDDLNDSEKTHDRESAKEFPSILMSAHKNGGI
jgi:hypothetical protein